MQRHQTILLSLVFIAITAISSELLGTTPVVIKKTLVWKDTPVRETRPDGRQLDIWSFEGAVYQSRHPELPYVVESFRLPQNATLRVRLTDARYAPLAVTGPLPEVVAADIVPAAAVETERDRFLGKVWLLPIRKSATGGYEKLVAFTLIVEWTPVPVQATARGPNNTFNSVLETGLVYKIAIPASGLYKLDYNFLKNELKLDVDKVDPRKLRLYGNGGGMLPEPVSARRADDLTENAIYVSGETDGRFDNSDYILFYGSGPDTWSFTGEGFTMQKNLYDDKAYYFLKIDADNGLRVNREPSLANTAYNTAAFDAYLRLEEDKINLLSRNKPATQGSGKSWLGEYFYTTREKNYTGQFVFPNLVTEEPVRVRSEFVARSGGTTFFQLVCNGVELNGSTIPGVSTGSVDDTYARTGYLKNSFRSSSDNIAVTVRFPATAYFSEGWLDFVEMNARRRLQWNGKQFGFRDSRVPAGSAATYRIANAVSANVVWDVTDPARPVWINPDLSGSELAFGRSTGSAPTEFVLFSTSEELPKPTALGKLENQNYHGIDNVDMVILYHKDFEKAANSLANHRRQHAGLSVATVRIDKLYNEFSSGTSDPTAIRDFARMLSDRNDRFQYLLLFGDGSFDYRGILTISGNTNFIPAYETNESYEPIESYPTDDYYALLSPNEGVTVGYALPGALDISVGRLPVRTAEEAQDVVNKIIRYETNPVTLGDWRNWLLFVADDGDFNLHFGQADGIASTLAGRYPDFNLDKVYLDATLRVSTPGGARFPDANLKLNDALFKGMLVVNYLGHGGPRGWAQERVLTNTDIGNWSNTDKLPLFVTATCSFSGYDDPTQTTGGEQVLLKENGGGIALFSTVRAVYSSSNERLTRAVFDTIFVRNNHVGNRIGDILKAAKNSNSADTLYSNARKFTLLGDPAMMLAMPRYGVTTTSINGRDVTINKADTIRALQKVTVEGYVSDDNGNVFQGFNGKVFPTVFDKAVAASTLGQSSDSQKEQFRLQKNVLFKGAASVVNGRFKFTFVVPKDIDYQYGFGKISYYATDGKSIDASGAYANVVVGGTDLNGGKNDQPPLVEVFMNDDRFKFGDITDQNPVLYVKLSDDNGINATGTTVGHDIVAILDNESQKSYLLNDFYQAALDDHTRGEVRYPLAKLTEGRHSIRVKAWDTGNNSNEGTTEFVVANNARQALEQVLNYPNPFTTKTNFQFRHKYPGQLLDVQIQIYTVAGQRVKFLESQVSSEGSLVTNISWDGLDDYGQPLARGVYLYKVRALPASDRKSGGSESGFEKLVILK